MTDEALSLWERAERTLESATLLLLLDPDNAASRAYYAAFHAVSALFIIEGKVFVKHTAVQAAVHRDLIATGRWPKELGADFSALQVLRQIGDYGGHAHVSLDDATKAIASVRRILEAVHQAHPRFFSEQQGPDNRR